MKNEGNDDEQSQDQPYRQPQFETLERNLADNPDSKPSKQTPDENLGLNLEGQPGERIEEIMDHKPERELAIEPERDPVE